MSDVFIKVEGFVGSSIENVAAEMGRLSEKLGIPVCCDFNGISLMFYVNDSPEVLAREYRTALKTKAPVKMACGH